MKIQVTQNDIQTALISHLQNMGINTSGQDISFTFRTTRKGDNSGVSAQVILEPQVANLNAPNIKSAAVAASPTVVKTEVEVAEESTAAYSTTASTSASLFPSS